MACASQWGAPCSYPDGYCSNVTLSCVCTLPAAAIGDFAVQHNEDCGLDFQTTRGFWVACAVLHFISLVVSLVTLTFSGDLNLTEIKLLLSIVACNACFLIVGALEGTATFPGEHSIGIDLTTTFFFVIGGSIYWIIVEAQVYVQTRMNPTPIGLQKYQSYRKAHKKSIPFQMAISTLAFLIVFGIIHDPANAYTYAAIHYLLLGILIILVSILMVVSLTAIIRDVRKAIVTSVEHQARLERVLMVLTNFRTAVIFQTISSGSISLAFGISTKLMRKSPYFLALIWLSISLPMMAYGASRLANSTKFRFLSSNASPEEKARLLDSPQSILPRLSLKSTSTPKSGKQTRRKRKQWKATPLDKVEENIVSTSEEALAPKGQD